MKLIPMIVIAAGVFGAGSTAEAQYRERSSDRLFWQIRDDLNRVTESSFADGRDRKRLEHTRHELNELQEKLDRGRYDRGELNDVIGALGNVVNGNRMDSQDRDLLNEDLHELYEFRERHERWRHDY